MSDQIFSETRRRNSNPTYLNGKIITCHQQPNLILHQIQAIYETNKFSDIDLIVRNNSILPSHRLILSASSDFFLNVFLENPFISFLEIKEVDSFSMKRILRFIYTGSIELCSETVNSILRAANLFRMQILIEACTTFMEDEIMVNNCLDFASIAWEHNNPRLLKKSLALAHEQFENIRKSKGFLNLNKELLRDFLLSDFLCVNSEESVCESLIDWMEDDPTNRCESLSSLFKDIVRYQSLDPLSISKIRDRVSGNPNCENVIFSWVSFHLDCTVRNINPKIRSRNMIHTYSIVCGESTDNWYVMTYDAVLDNWSKSSLPKCIKKREFFKTIAANDKQIIVGGKLDGVITASVECVDIKILNWKDLPSMRTARVGHAIALIDGDLYVFGGSDCQANPLTSVERFEFATERWSYESPLPFKISYSHRFAVADDLFYLVDTYKPLSILCFDVLLRNWNEINFDHDVTKVYDMAVMGVDLYTCLADGEEKSIERFSRGYEKWTKLPSDEIQRFVNPRFFALCEKLIFYEKVSDNSNIILVEMYDPVNGSLTPLTQFEESLYEINIK